MKRVVITIIVMLIAFPLVLGGILWFTYQNISEDTIPPVSLTVLETDIPPAGYEWNSPVFGGMMYKEFYQNPGQDLTPAGTLTEPHLPLTVPAGYTSTARLSFEGQDIWSGPAADVEAYSFLDNGAYELEVECKAEPESGRGYGSFVFRASFTVQVEVRLEQSAEEVQQGDVLALQFFNLPSGAAPQATAWESPVVFVPNGEGRMLATIAPSHDAEPGQRSVTVTLDDQSWAIAYTVTAADFPEQHMTIDLSNETISEANSAAAYQQYNDTIPPLFEEWDDACYWQGSTAFSVPAKGEVNTQYGLYRYTNGAATASRHPALDIGAPTGTPVVAPAGGRVLLAEHLLNTGNTLVIEHGGGLKSLFYHMDSLEVSTGDIVAQDDPVGTVGTTGYSTGPHLHYEVRLFGMSVDPIALFTGQSGLFAFTQQAGEDPAETPSESESDSASEDPASTASSRGLPPGLTWPSDETPEDDDEEEDASASNAASQSTSQPEADDEDDSSSSSSSGRQKYDPSSRERNPAPGLEDAYQ